MEASAPAGWNPVPTATSAVEDAVRTIGGQLLASMQEQPSPGILTSKGINARLIEWSLRDPAFKARLFRFVDVLPALESSAEVVRHLQEYLGEGAVELHPAFRAGLGAASVAPGLVAGPVRGRVAAMARQFVAGESVEDLAAALPRQRRGRHGHHHRPPGRDRPLRGGGGRVPGAKSRGARHLRPGPSRRGALPERSRPPRPRRTAREPLGEAVGPGAGRPARRPRGRRRFALAPPPPHPAPRRRDRRLRQLRHGEHALEGAHAGALPLHPGGGRVPGGARRRDRHPGLPARERARPAPAHRLGEVPRPAHRRAAGEGSVLGQRDGAGATARVAGARLDQEARDRPRLRAALGALARERRRGPARLRHAQPPLGGTRPRAGRAARRRPARGRVPGALRHGRRSQGGPAPGRLPRARVLRRRRPPARDGVPGAPASREHQQRELPAAAARRGRARPAAREPGLPRLRGRPAGRPHRSG